MRRLMNNVNTRGDRDDGTNENTNRYVNDSPLGGQSIITGLRNQLDD